MVKRTVKKIVTARENPSSVCCEQVGRNSMSEVGVLSGSITIV